MSQHPLEGTVVRCIRSGRGGHRIDYTVTAVVGPEGGELVRLRYRDNEGRLRYKGVALSEVEDKYRVVGRQVAA